MYRANLWCRTAVRILRPIAEFTIDAQAADSYRSLYAQVQEIDWAAYLRPTGSLAIDPVVHGQVLTNSLYAAQVAKDAIVDGFRDRFGERPSVDRLKPDLRLNLHVSGDRATVYLDASGQSLHKRGYRRQTGEAPLNEVLAAGILRLTGWNGCSPLVDFLCGSGTLPIEGALIARNRAPGLLRDDFGYRRWLDFDAELEAQAIEQARAAAQPAARQRRSADLWLRSRSNRHRRRGRECRPCERYGRHPIAGGQFRESRTARGPRHDHHQSPLRPAAESGRRWRVLSADRLSRATWPVSRWRGYTAWVLAGNLEAAEQFDLVPAASYPLRNGPIDCRLLKFGVGRIVNRRLEARIAHAPVEKPVSATRSSPAEALRNRLARMGKHWARWARRQEISCYRIYDCDLPEVPWTIDRYEDRLQIVEHESPHGRSPLEHRQWFDGLLAIVGEALDTPLEAKNIHAHPDDESIGAIQAREGAQAGQTAPSDLTWPRRVAQSRSILVGATIPVWLPICGHYASIWRPRRRASGF